MSNGNLKNNHPDNPISFNCGFCGRQIIVTAIHAGKKGKCPRCNKIIIVPLPAPMSPTSKPVQQPDLELLLQPIPLQQKSPADQPKDQQYELLRQTAGIETEAPPPKRSLPWLLDIFLYPANFQGMIFMIIAVIIPLILQLISIVLCFLGFIFSLYELIIAVYVYWFLAHCVRDSAAGGLRAPETITENPDLWEMAWQIFELFTCLAVCVLPAMIYYLCTEKKDTIFWSLTGFGAFLYPMLLLAVVMFDSINALNPLIIIPSIFIRFFQYCGLVIILSALIFLYLHLYMLLPKTFFLRMFMSPLIQMMELYLLMIAMHLIGRFYFKYQHKLNWDV